MALDTQENRPYSGQHGFTSGGLHVHPTAQNPGSPGHGAMNHENVPSKNRRARLTPPLVLGAATIGGCIAVAAANPDDFGTPLCMSRSVFGVDCPFCGGLRATNALLRGNFGAALDHNVILAVALPVVAMMWIWWVVREWRGEGPPPVRVPRWITVTAAVLLVAFGVVRNFGGPGWVRWLNSGTFVG